MKKIVGVILAAGKSKRMKSNTIKIFHKIFDKYIIEYVIEKIKDIVNQLIIVISPDYKNSKILQELKNKYKFDIAIQQEAKGTGDALYSCKDKIKYKEAQLLVVSGDTPLLSEKELDLFLKLHNNCSASIFSVDMPDPYGYGRIIRKNGQFYKIVEEKDATTQEKEVKEINSGIYIFNYPEIFKYLEKLDNDNAQKEYYLTQVFNFLLNDNKIIQIYNSDNYKMAQGINTRKDLTTVFKYINEIKLEKLQEQGITILDPLSTYISLDTQIDKDTIIYPNCYITGKTKIGKNCKIGPNVKIINSIIGDNVKIDISVLNNVEIKNNVNIGPFAYLRPETLMKNDSKAGSFVEIKKSIIGQNSKVPHLSYIGDAEIGKNVNIGAGAITANYDGKNKNKTIIKDNSFIGINANLIAPIVIGQNSLIGAGAVVKKNVEDNLVVVGVPAKPIRKRS